MTHLEELTTIFRAFLQDTLVSADLTVQLDDESPCRVIEIDLGDADRAHVGTLLQSLLDSEIRNVEDTLADGRNIIGEPIQSEAMYYDVRVRQDGEDDYNYHNVKASSVDDALQIAFCLDGGINGKDYGGPRNLLILAKTYAEVVK